MTYSDIFLILCAIVFMVDILQKQYAKYCDRPHRHEVEDRAARYQWLARCGSEEQKQAFRTEAEWHWRRFEQHKRDALAYPLARGMTP